jgi:hypothetical protein
MIVAPKNVFCPPLSSDRACVSYLFRKRWPEGFRCSFCGAQQKRMPPACVVVCRYCRKQNSITAHTLMHGSKKSLVAWMLVAWQFCLREQGVSARELQRLMELSCYQTAWSWLQKIRQGAALAESAQCRGVVLFDKYLLSLATAQKTVVPEIAIALELGESGESIRRVRFEVLQPQECDASITALENTIEKGSVLLVPELNVLSLSILQSYSCIQSTGEQRKQGGLLFQEMELWLNSVYRRAIDAGHLQSYLDEFSFRYNTSSWPDNFTVFDHLVTGLVAIVVKKQEGIR